MRDTKQIIEDVDSIKSLLSDAATAGGFDRTLDDKRYGELRAKLFDIARIQELLPSFLRSRPRLTDFRLLAQEKGGYVIRRAFVAESFAPLLNYLHDELQNPIGTPMTEVLTKIDSPHVVKACQKAMDRVQVDPDGAITSARSLLETVCKYILDEQGETYSKGADLHELYRRLAATINLAPDQQSESDLRQMLSGCISVVHGLAALRNRVGDAHGKTAEAGAVERHHAALGVGIACSVASFLIESWEMKNGQTPIRSEV